MDIQKINHEMQRRKNFLQPFYQYNYIVDYDCFMATADFESPSNFK